MRVFEMCDVDAMKSSEMTPDTYSTGCCERSKPTGACTVQYSIQIKLFGGEGCLPHETQEQNNKVTQGHRQEEGKLSLYI